MTDYNTNSCCWRLNTDGQFCLVYHFPQDFEYFSYFIGTLSIPRLHLATWRRLGSVPSQVLNLGTFNKKPFSNYRGEQAFCGPQPQPLVDISISRSEAPQFPPVSQYLIFEWKLKIEKHPNIKCDGISPLDFLDLTLKPSEENRQKWIVVQ